MSDSIRLDPELAARADALFRELGLDLSTAVQLFLLQSLREQGLPFTPRLAAPAAAEPPMRAAERDESGEQNARSAASSLPPDDDGPTPRRDERPAPEEEPARDARLFDDDQEEPEVAAPLDHDDASGREDSPLFDASAPETEENDVPREDDELRQAFLNARLIGAPLRRVRSLNRLYGIGDPNPHVQGWREVYVSGDEPFALDFGVIRVELGFHGGGSLRMMDGRLPDSVLEADAVYPRDLSAVFSSVIGQPLSDVSSTRLRHDGREQEQLSLHFANGCTLNFTPGGDWGALWLADAHGSVMFAPEAVWLRVLGDKAWNGLRRMGS